MTTCRCSARKSSVYNQTGQSYFEQLSAYNHMSAHLRRVLLAKSRVDSRNPTYLQKQRSKSLTAEKPLENSISQELIDRLAYDTEHHPFEVLRRSTAENREKIRGLQDPPKASFYNSGTWYTECTANSRQSVRSCSMSGSRLTRGGEAGRMKPTNSENKSRPGGPISFNSSAHSSPRSEKKADYASSFESLSLASARDSPNPQGSIESVSLTSGAMRASSQPNADRSLDANSEDAKYAKFLYDITQEIVQNGYYTDEELKTVLKKHMDKNAIVLNKDKMIYELYQLKQSLNIVDNDNEEEEERIQRFIESQKFAAVSPMKPPTPPKVLDENKLVDKLMSEDELRQTYSKSPHSGRNAVVLVDANPELIVTEKDILATLLEMNIEPEKAHTVYRRLQRKSKDLINVPMVQADDELPRSSAKLTRVSNLTEEFHRSREFRPKRKELPEIAPQFSSLLRNIKCPEEQKTDRDQRHSRNEKKCQCQIRKPQSRLSYRPEREEFRQNTLKIPCEKRSIGVQKNKSGTSMASSKSSRTNMEILKNLAPTIRTEDKKNFREKKNLDIKTKNVIEVLQKIAEVVDTNGGKDCNKSNQSCSKTTKLESSNCGGSKTQDRPKKLSPSQKSRTRDVESSVITVAIKSPEVIKEIQRHPRDDIEESIAESFSEDDSIVEVNSARTNHEVYSEKYTSPSETDSDVEEIANASDKTD